MRSSVWGTRPAGRPWPTSRRRKFASRSAARRRLWRQSSKNLSAVAQSGGNAVDRQMNPADDRLARVAAAIALQQLDLHMVERIEIGKAVADRTRQQRIAFQQ